MTSKQSFFSDLRSAILFMSILPAGKNVKYSPLGMIKFFPVAGLVLGAFLLAFDLIASNFWMPSVVALLDVLFLVILTGALHLDGLGDTADGIFSHRPPEKALEIMKDSRTGIMGTAAVFSALSLKIAGIFSIKTIGTGSEVLLLIIPAYSRSGMLFGIKFLNYGRKGRGTGLDFFEKSIRPKDFSLFLIPFAISLFLGYRGLFLNLIFLSSVWLILVFYKKKMNCITGDMLGAMNEVLEAVLFLGIGILK